MMMGPEPMMRIRWMSVRLGIRVLGHQGHEIVEKIAGVVWTRRGFGVVLDAEYRMISQPESFERLVVEIDVGDLGVCGVERFGIDGETVIVRGDLDFVSQLVDDRMVRAAMAKFHLVSLAADREAEDLVAQADSEDRNLADQAPHTVDLGSERLGVARTVREKHAVGLESQGILGRS